MSQTEAAYCTMINIKPTSGCIYKIY